MLNVRSKLSHVMNQGVQGGDFNFIKVPTVHILRNQGTLGAYFFLFGYNFHLEFLVAACNWIIVLVELLDKFDKEAAIVRAQTRTNRGAKILLKIA